MPTIEVSEETAAELRKLVSATDHSEPEDEDLACGHPLEGKYVVITDTVRGISAGYLVQFNGERALIRNMRSVHYYRCKKGHESTAGLATAGPQTGSKIQPAVPGLSDFGPVARILPCSPEAQKIWEGASWG